MSNKMPEELKELLEKVLKKAVEMKQKIGDENLDKIGGLLASLEALKFLLAEQIPEHVYHQWLAIYTHYSAATGMVLKEIATENSTKESRELMEFLHDRMKKFLDTSEKSFCGLKDENSKRDKS